jgi:hypothetical protein
MPQTWCLYVARNLVETALKQKFVFNPRRKGRSVLLQTSRSVPGTGRSKTIYLGTFSRAMNPDLLVNVRSLAPGQDFEGLRLGAKATVSLDAGDCARIRGWLEEHGTYRALKERQGAAQRALEDAAAREKKSMRAELEAELAATLAGCWRPSSPLPDGQEASYALVQAEQAFELASKQLVEAARKARLAGGQLSSLRSQNMDPSCSAGLLDELQARANRVRLAGLEKFTAACQDAGLMERRRQRQE